MTREKIFFSYSRADSDFALKLANDLRKAGSDPWVDQLSIEGGNRWDSVIEDALLASTCMVVILSPASMSSENVKDEVTFALKKNKKILPVLLKACEPIYRLVRLQHIDFTGNYEKGVNNLLKALNITAHNDKDDKRSEPAKQTQEPQKTKKEKEPENDPYLPVYVALMPNERKLGMWRVSYIPPDGKTYHGALSITTKRLFLFEMREYNLLRNDFQIYKSEIKGIRGERVLNQQKLILMLTDSSTHTIMHSLNGVENLIKALQSRE